MAKNKIELLKNRYQGICDSYIEYFVRKQGYAFEGWVGQDIGGIANFIDQYFFSMNDIVYDVNNKCEKGLIFAWQDHNIELGEDKRINYHSYHKGLRMTK